MLDGVSFVGSEGASQKRGNSASGSEAIPELAAIVLSGAVTAVVAKALLV
jgi:hypothetical protein